MAEDAGLVIDYTINPELSPILQAVEQQFVTLTDMTTAEALAQQPHGGQWVTTWLGVLQDLGDWESEHRVRLIEQLTWALADFQARVDEWVAGGEDPKSPFDAADFGRLRAQLDEATKAVPHWHFATAKHTFREVLYRYYEMVNDWNEGEYSVLGGHSRRNVVVIAQFDTWELNDE
jgi:hypothetical protein